MSGSLLSDQYAAGASIPLGVRPVQQADPFEMAGKVASINNAMAQNKLINQNTQNAALSNKTQQYALNQQQMADLTRNIGVLAMDQNDANQTPENYAAIIDKAVATGMDPALAARVKQMIPPGGTPQQYRTMGMAKYLGMSGIPSAEIVALLAPKAGPIIDSGKTQQGSVVGAPLDVGGISRNAGITSPAGPVVTNTTSPAQGGAPTTLGVDPNTLAPRVGTLDQFVDAAKGGAPSPLGNGRMLPGPLLNPNNPQSAGKAPGVTMASPVDLELKRQTALDSSKAFDEITNQGLAAKSQAGVLGNMLGDSSLMNSGQTKLNDFKATLTKYAPSIATSFGIKPESVAASESLDKLAAQLAQASGQGSDARLAVAQTGNPSGHLSPAGLDQMLRQLQGNADYQQARAKLAAAWADKGDRRGFEASSAVQALDPRAFQYARMTRDQRKTYSDSLSRDDREAVRAAYNAGLKSNVIVPQQ